MKNEQIVTAAFVDELKNILAETKVASPGEMRPQTSLATMAPKVPTVKAAPKVGA